MYAVLDLVPCVGRIRVFKEAHGPALVVRPRAAKQGMPILGCIALQQDDPAGRILVETRLLLGDLVGLHPAADPGAIVQEDLAGFGINPIDEIAPQKWQHGPVPINDADLAGDLLMKKLEQEVEPRIGQRLDELMDRPRLVIDKSTLDLRQFGVFGDRDLDRDHALLDLKQELVLHLVVLTPLLGRHLIVADGVILARQFGQPILLLRLEHHRGHDPGELVDVLRRQDFLVEPTPH